MKKIVMLPLDERPCNFNYPQMMPKADYALYLPPKELMGDKKTPADTAALQRWLMENIGDADACILSLDTLVYGGIVPSRLHGESKETLFKRAETVRELRRLNPRMKFYAFQLIMRCPGYSLSDEEPDYYDICGEEIHLYGRYTHLASLRELTAEESAEFARVKKKIPAECLNDFTSRRETNLAVLLHDLEYVKDGTLDYFIVPQDDAAEYGFTSLDQIRVREYFKKNTLHMKTAMYPSADDTGLTLLARAVNELNGVRPKIFVKYASSKAEAVVPWFEDRVLDETVKYQIMAAGAQRVYSLPEADMALLINMGSGMWHEGQAGYVTAYDIERNLAEFVSYMRYALEAGKTVAVGDVATCNGSDEELLRIMREEGLLLKIHSYAGWNTSSNTLGTAICAGLLYLFGQDDEGRIGFLLHRYYEDCGYMTYARGYVTENVLPALGLDRFRVDGKDGKAAAAVKEKLTEFMEKNFPELARRVAAVQIEQPWKRMFETDVKLKLKS